jgi:anti-sigma B factor antagonist
VAIPLRPVATTLLHWTGELDLSRADELCHAVESLEALPFQRVVVDLAGVTFMDSTGLNALVRLHRRVTAVGGVVTVARPPAQIARLLDVAGLTQIIPVDGARTG